MAAGKAVDPEIEQFAQETIDSFVTWDVLLFFHDWQGFSGDTHAIAKNIGRSRAEVEQSLGHLVSLSILQAADTENGKLYSYSPPQEKSRQIERFASLLEQRELRLSLLASLLRKGIR